MSARIILRIANALDRESIYRLRHDVYAVEVRQHAPNEEGRLTDALDDRNVYVVAERGGRVAAFVSITPPDAGTYSIDKYFRRSTLPFPCDDGLHEVRLLTVARRDRGTPLACLMMYAALRWIATRGGRRVVAIGRHEVLDLYERVGLERLGRTAICGECRFDLMTATVARLEERVASYESLLARLRDRVDWRLGVPFEAAATCFHGGAFFDAVGPAFDTLHRRHEVVSADVLDAWFPPTPRAVRALAQDLPWMLRTSPPTECRGLVSVIARVRSVPEASIVVGAGSSDLIFRTFPHFVTRDSRALVLDPAYGEYAHVLERVIGCAVERLGLERGDGWRLDPARLLGLDADLIVLVNPNNPTGQYVSGADLETVLRCIPPRTRVWVDEAYLEYVDGGRSLERFAAQSRNVVVCKSMSKVYALSGARCAYLVAPPAIAHGLRAATPPWVVSLPAQVAAVAALEDPGYYAPRYEETARLRSALVTDLEAIDGVEVEEGALNFIVCRLPCDATEVLVACRERDVFIRDLGPVSARYGTRSIRISVKDEPTNCRVVATLAEALRGAPAVPVASHTDAAGTPPPAAGADVPRSRRARNAT
jgi:histidinol-phosphate/aromatic aminotransferase/cobyric acid decarboxylase-like protein/predicted GNAT family N-acyltransferase